jgi:hypothetical protein
VALKIDLDHVAIALNDVGPTLNTLVADFGAAVLFGGANIGFRAMQVDGGDLRIELLEPHNTELNDFLARFLSANGEGPHHLTFKTDDIEGLIARLEGGGYSLVGVNIGNPWWREAFVHPKQAGGTVVQIAQSSFEPLDFEQEVREYGPGRWWSDPPAPTGERAILRRVVVTTDEMSRALGLYRDVLQGDPDDHGEGWTELVWPSGGRIRLEHAAGRPQGIDRLEWQRSGDPTDLVVGGTSMVLSPRR